MSRTFRAPWSFLWGSCQGEPCCKRRKLFILGPGRSKRPAKLGNSAHQHGALESQNVFSAVHEFLLFDREITEATASARVKNRLAKQLTVGGVNQPVGSKNLVQRGQRPARCK